MEQIEFINRLERMMGQTFSLNERAYIEQLLKELR